MSRFGRKNKVTLGGVLLHLLPAALLACLFVGVGVMHVASRVLVVDAAYRISRLEQKSRELSLSNDRLKLELATLKGPTRLERVAREQLGMVPAQSSAVISVSHGPARLARSSPVDRPGVADRRIKPLPTLRVAEASQ
jgi:cell division protein FtsL